jgi:hypothetical protein
MDPHRLYDHLGTVNWPESARNHSAPSLSFIGRPLQRNRTRFDLYQTPDAAECNELSPLKSAKIFGKTASATIDRQFLPVSGGKTAAKHNEIHNPRRHVFIETN